MSQTTPDASATGTGDSNSDDGNSLADALDVATSVVESIDADEMADMSDEELVRVRRAIKELADESDDVRSDVVDAEVKSRIDVGESLLGLKRIGSHKKYVKSDPATVIGRAGSQGIDWTQFVSLDATTLASDYPDLAEIGRSKYDYLR